MSLSRRRFVLGAAGATCVAGTPLAAVGRSEHVSERCYRRFAARVKDNPRLDPYRSINVDALAAQTMRVEGRLPKGLRGVLYRNGPAGFERGRSRYQHWFDGDGMVQRFEINESGIVHSGRKVVTGKYRAESDAGRFLFRGSGSSIRDPAPSPNNDSGNPANISVVPWNDELLAMWEGGSAFALNPETLDTKRRVVWSDETDGMPFSAHPILEPDGTMWNFGLAQWARHSEGQGLLAIYRLHSSRGLEKVELVQLPFAGYMHSFAATPHWLVFYVAPHVLDPKAGSSYVDSHRFRPTLGGRILLVDKNDFKKRRWVDAPAGFVFHFADALERPDGEIQLRVCWFEDADPMQKSMHGVMCGDKTSVDETVKVATLRIRSDWNRARIERSGIEGEFPGIDSRFQREGGGFLWVTDNDRLHLLTRDGSARTLRAPDGLALEEHRFVPVSPEAPEGAGWLLGTAYDHKRRQSALTIFDTRSASSDPVAVARMERRIPFGFHGWFVSD